MMVSHKSISKIIKYLEINFERIKNLLLVQRISEVIPFLVKKVSLKEDIMKKQENLSTKKNNYEEESSY